MQAICAHCGRDAVEGQVLCRRTGHGNGTRLRTDANSGRATDREVEGWGSELGGWRAVESTIRRGAGAIFQALEIVYHCVENGARMAG